MKSFQDNDYAKMQTEKMSTVDSHPFTNIIVLNTYFPKNEYDKQYGRYSENVSIMVKDNSEDYKNPSPIAKEIILVFDT